MDRENLGDLADAFAFIGNSLLTPMSRTESIGLEPSFWDAFPDFDDASVVSALGRLKEFAEESQVRIDAGEDMVERVSVEYTRLFIGPPSPAAPPWETMNREDGISVGFGQPTFEMRDILKGMGLQVGNENNQYADHMGIELLTLSEMLHRVQAGEAQLADASAFAREHPSGWIQAFRDKVHACFPDSYFDRLLGLAQSLLQLV